MNNFFRKLSGLFIVIASFFAVTQTSAQSRDQNYPTAVTSNEIVGSIKARDVGDSRTTSYYYAFGGSQGDIFINVVTKNFVGDIDVFVQDGLRPLTKMVIFDGGLNETGRLIYLRKDEKLVLRVQGRTPNDDASSIRIKFGGAFVALAPQKEEAPPAIETPRNDSRTVVNSVGTIVEVKPKPQPIKDLPAIAEKKPEVKEPKTVATEQKPKTPAVNKKPEVVVESTIKEPEKVAAKPSEKPAESPSAAKKPVETRKPEEKKVDPLASIHLIILMKDGARIERLMSEVLKFSVDKGVLTVIAKTGAISKFSILDVAKVTIE